MSSSFFDNFDLGHHPPPASPPVPSADHTTTLVIPAPAKPQKIAPSVPAQPVPAPEGISIEVKPLPPELTPTSTAVRRRSARPRSALDKAGHPVTATGAPSSASGAGAGAAAGAAGVGLERTAAGISVPGLLGFGDTGEAGSFTALDRLRRAELAKHFEERARRIEEMAEERRAAAAAVEEEHTEQVGLRTRLERSFHAEVVEGTARLNETRTALERRQEELLRGIIMSRVALIGALTPNMDWAKVAREFDRQRGFPKPA